MPCCSERSGSSWWYRRRDVPSGPDVPDTSRPEGPQEPTDFGSPDAGQTDPGPTDSGQTDPGPTTVEAIRPTDEEVIVSSADRIERLLDEHGGRMRQAEIVDLLDWSKSKVSRVLSSMEEQDRVRKIRLGRENLIVLPGCEPQGAAPPE